MHVRAPRHYPCLDGLRALAILLVVPHNADIVTPVTQGPFKIFTLLIDRGWIGVQLFFVLSGFLITEQLYASRPAANYFSGFYARRVLRIVPLFLAAVLLSLLLIKILAVRGYSGAAAPAWLLWLGLFFVNWTQPLGLSIPGLPQFWSLAVEEQFYIVWPVVVRLCTARLMAIMIGIVLLALGLRTLMLLNGATPNMVYMWTICRMDALAFGGIAALVIQRWRVRGVIPRPGPCITGALLVLLMGALPTRIYASDTWATQTVGFTCLGFTFMLVLLAALAHDLAPRPSRIFAVLHSRLLASVGRYSFGMYVFHMFFGIFAAAWITRVAASFGQARMLVCALIVMVLSYAMGLLSYELYEKRFLRLGRYFAPQLPAAA
jgi:peptidoglycan/LPS O-acetylase OafA/YrhL